MSNNLRFTILRCDAFDYENSKNETEWHEDFSSWNALMDEEEIFRV